MNTVSITITGPAGSGKSTIAQAIARSLSFNHDIEVVVHDEDGSSDDWEGERVEACLEALAERTTVVVTTQQSVRSAKEQ